MATLTYDPTPADQPEFTPEEQDSIQVGEALEQQEQQLLAGKYENAQQLEKAYVELQRKLGDRTEDQESDVPEEASDSEEEVEEEQVEEEETQEEGPPVITEQDVQILYKMVGGQEKYAEMTSWAQENMSEKEVGMFNHVMDLGNPFAALFAVRALQNAYVNANGSEGELLTGGAPTERADVFRSQAEVVEAMSDPRYEKDAAYRNDVFEKLDRSDLQF